MHPGNSNPCRSGVNCTVPPITRVKVVFICFVNIRGDAEVKAITSFPFFKVLSPFPHPLSPQGPSDHCPVRRGTEPGVRFLPPLSWQGSKSPKGHTELVMWAHLLHTHTEITRVWKGKPAVYLGELTLLRGAWWEQLKNNTRFNPETDRHLDMLWSHR